MKKIRIIINRVFNIIGRLLPDKIFLQIKYKILMGKKLELSTPVLFSEKMQWLKLYDRKIEYTELVDKYLVKDVVKKELGEKYIIPTLGIWNNFSDIDFKTLPHQFVLKCTHDSGGIIICKDKNKLDMINAKKIIERSLKRNYFYSNREWPYKNVKPRIIAEQYLENGEEGLHDYKVWCFNGEPKYIQYISGRIKNITYEAFYDLNWKKQSFYFHNPILKKDVVKPKNLAELINSARILSKNKPFSRCDFYVLEDGSLKFGEITFFPMSGLETWKPREMDKKIGEMIKIFQENID